MHTKSNCLFFLFTWRVKTFFEYLSQHPTHAVNNKGSNHTFLSCQTFLIYHPFCSIYLHLCLCKECKDQEVMVSPCVFLANRQFLVLLSFLKDLVFILGYECVHNAFVSTTAHTTSSNFDSIQNRPFLTLHFLRNLALAKILWKIFEQYHVLGFLSL